MRMKPLACCTCIVLTLGAGGPACATRRVTLPDVPLAPARTLRRFPAPEASQAVAVDERFFYAIGSTAIAKYDKATGNRIAGWKPGAGEHVAHLNSGIIVDGALYCANSNYPETPMVSSIEVFDPAGMAHVKSIALPDTFGSATWVDRAGQKWWVAFAHYAGKGGVPGRGPEATRLVRLSNDWKVEESFRFPPAVVERWGRMSSSGGVIVSPGVFLTTGHDAPEIYVLEVPGRGSTLRLRAIVPIESKGQGIALDRTTAAIYSIQRSTREVLVSSLPRGISGVR